MFEQSLDQRLCLSIFTYLKTVVGFLGFAFIFPKERIKTWKDGAGFIHPISQRESLVFLISQICKQMTNIDYKGNLKALVMSDLRGKDLKGIILKTANLTNNNKICLSRQMKSNQGEFEKGTILQCLIRKHTFNLKC